MPVPDCNVGTGSSSGNVLTPGLHPSGIRINGNGTYTMKSGLYCIKGDFTVNGGATLTGEGVTIVMLDGSIDFIGGGTINLTRPNSLEDPSGNNWGGMLIYMPMDNNGGIDMGGGSGSFYSGTVYAPGPRKSVNNDRSQKCEVSGSGTSIGVNSNLICYSINISGTANVSITYKEEQNYRRPPMVELVH